MKLVHESLHEYNEALNEGWKENVLAGILMMAGVTAAQAQRTLGFKIPLPGHEKSYTMQKTTQDSTEVQNLLEKGWTLDNVKLDTVWNSLQKTHDVKPDSVSILSSSVKSGESFTPGGFELTPEFKESLKSTLYQFHGKPFVNIRIEASTDKQGLKPSLKNILTKYGYTEDNAGLVQARADVIKKYLSEELNVNADSIIYDLKPEQGQGSKEEYKSGVYRYVRVEFNFVNIEIKKFPKEKEDSILNVSQTYDLSKEIKTKTHPEINLKFRVKPIKINFNNFKHEKRGMVKCSKFHKR